MWNAADELQQDFQERFFLRRPMTKIGCKEMKDVNGTAKNTKHKADS